MPTVASASAVGHLYATPEIKENERGKWCRIRFWTSDKVKGQDEKKFTSWGGMVSGPQAEWIAKDGKKGTMVFVSGSIRLDTFKKNDGTESHTIEFTRITECRVLDRQEEGEQAEAPAPAPRRPAAPAPSGGGGDDDSSPPFMRRCEWE